MIEAATQTNSVVPSEAEPGNSGSIANKQNRSRRATGFLS
jgi:hypothetical protein